MARRVIAVAIVTALGMTALSADAMAGEWFFGPFGAGVPDAPEPHPALAMNAAGEAALAFTFNGVRVSLRPANGYFERPEWGGVRVSAEGVEGSSPSIAIDDRGDLVAVWVQNTGAHPQIYEATRPAGGSFQAPQAVSPEDEAASTPSVGLDEHGTATVAWLSNDGTNQRVDLATASHGKAFSPPFALTGDGANASSPNVAINAGGDAAVTWQRDDGAGSELEVAMRERGGAFPGPDAQGDGEILGQTAAGAESTVLVDPLGEMLAVWRAPTGEVLSAHRGAGSPVFAAASVLASASGRPSAAMNSSGEAVTAWPSGETVQVATAPPGGAFGSPVTLPAAFAPGGTSVAIGVSGNVAVEWELLSENEARQGTSRPHGGSFGPIQSLWVGRPGAEGSLAVASDAGGDLVGVWSQAGFFDDMTSMFYDAGPQLEQISAPSAVAVGQPAGFGIAMPSSVWRPVNSIEWSFGDGTSASGLTVAHAYNAPGTYRVTVTATDTQGRPPIPGLFPGFVGNSQSQTITVTPAPAGQAPAPNLVPVRQSISGLRIQPTSFLAAPSGSSATAAHRRTGATVRFALTIPGRVTFSVLRKRTRRCAAPKHRSGTSRHRRCTLTKTIGRFTRIANAGSNSFHFTGRVSGRKLEPGDYALATSAVGANAAGARIAFRILSRG